MKKNYFPHIGSFLFSFFAICNVCMSQTYNAVDWGTYFNDNAHYPDFNYEDNDNADRIVANHRSPESIYVVGKTFAPTTLTLSVCSGNESLSLDYGTGYLAKYDNCGNLKWSTYIGSYAYCVALDKENGKSIIYVAGKGNAGQAFRCDGNSTPILQDNKKDGGDAFIAKYADDDTSASLLRWTWFGGSGGTETIYAMDIYKHHLYTTGITESPDTYVGAQHKGDTTYGGGSDDSFIAEFDSMLSKLIYFSYIGGEGEDRGHDIKVSKTGGNPLVIYASGSTDSEEGIGMGTGFSLTFGGVNDAFMSKWVESNGTISESWCTYIGGSGNEHGRNSVIDRQGNVFLSGFTGSTDFPVSPNAYDTSFAITGIGSSGTDAFIIKLNGNGGKIWATYYGGNLNEEVNGMVLLKSGKKQYLAITGVTRSVSTYFDLASPLLGLLNGNDQNTYYDDYIAVFRDTAVAQQLTFATYLGGSQEERDGAGLYHPSLAAGLHNELYFAGVSESDDIKDVMGSSFQKLVQPYNGGVDAFFAKLINTNNPRQKNCDGMKINSELPASVNDIVVSPNPSAGNFAITYNGDAAVEMQISVYNLMQQKVYSRKYSGIVTGNVIPCDISGLSEGTYLMELIYGGDTSYKMVVIAR